MPAALRRSGAHSSAASDSRSSSVTASMRSISSSGSSSGSSNSVEPPRRFMRAAGGLEPQHDPRLDVLLGPLELLRRGGIGAQPAQLLPHDLHGLAEVVRSRADVQADLARVRERAREREDGVGEPALLADGLEQARRRQAAEDGVQHAAGEAPLVVAVECRRRRGRRAPARCPCAGSGLSGRARGALRTGPRPPGRRREAGGLGQPHDLSWSTEPAAAITIRDGT